jgi:Do/DeqQ family serine protease
MKNGITLIFASILGGAIALGGSYLLTPQPEFINTYSDQEISTSQKPTPRYSLVSNPDGKPTEGFAKAAEKSMPAVVHINTLQERKPRNRREQQMFDFFGYPAPSEGSGSGVIIKKNGYILTNNHVIEGATKLEVTLYDKRKYKATIVGTDPGTDMAVIKIEEENLPTLAFADSDKAKVGEWILAVGNPYELTSTVTAGIISAKGRSINILDDRGVESFIQTDAAVNPGNSGGALVNTEGKLLGINTAIASPTGSYTGYSFAVPINLASKIAHDLISFGEVRRAFMGIAFYENNSELAKERQLPIATGIYVKETIENGSAEAAGIRPGDIIIEVNNVKIHDMPTLKEQIGSHHPGDTLAFKIYRGSQIKDFDVVLKTR